MSRTGKQFGQDKEKKRQNPTSLCRNTYYTHQKRYMKYSRQECTNFTSNRVESMYAKLLGRMEEAVFAKIKVFPFSTTNRKVILVFPSKQSTMEISPETLKHPVMKYTIKRQINKKK
jgi:hypothetical protein